MGDTTGLVTQFEIQPAEVVIPTPALLPGLVGFGIGLSRRKRKQR
ncbi:MAG: PTPA-CTERM sorting domain-containing protein [Leptolyngbyaceae cyanobacterium SL_7_1]|nr:PTPA-CTERM sorting domain-containing protein [Leptolyngbyaceae cyanobacterium SL_7_1]